MKSGMFINYILLLLGILGIIYVSSYKKCKEAFLSKSVYFSDNFNPGSFPVSQMKGMLYGDYKQKNNPAGLSDYRAETALDLFPAIELGSFDQKTNNIRYWPTPCDGSSTPSAFCGGMYEKKTFNIKATSPPQVGCRRVNYYCSH